MGKRELIALLNLSSWCLVMVERLFLAVPQGSLQFVIVVFPDHTHLLFLHARTGSGSGPLPPGKSQVAIVFLRNTGTDPYPPLEMQMYPLGPIASQGRSVPPSVK